jgi:hypothetical protein
MLYAVYDVPFWMCNIGRYHLSKLLALFFVPFILEGLVGLCNRQFLTSRHKTNILMPSWHSVVYLEFEGATKLYGT